MIGGMTALPPPRPGNGTGRRLVRCVVPAAAALVLATPVTTWWLVGDQSTVAVSAGRDYAFTPWGISPVAAQAAGIGSLGLAMAAMLVLGWAARRHLFDARWWLVLISLLAAGVIAGAGWRVMTAGVIGANIGAGMVIMIGGPLFATLLVSALAGARYLLARAHRARTRPLARRPDELTPSHPRNMRHEITAYRRALCKVVAPGMISR
jgi:hypothetical protein